jgi:hypothetical protein
VGVGSSMLEVMLGVTMFVFLMIEVYLLYLVKAFKHSEPLRPLLERIEGKLQLTLEKIEDAVDEIEPPTVAESLAQCASMFMQGRMMDKMQLQPEPQLNEGEHVRVDSWPADAPPKSPTADELLNQ